MSDPRDPSPPAWFSTLAGVHVDGPARARLGARVIALEDDDAPAAGFTLTPATLGALGEALYLELHARTARTDAPVALDAAAAWAFRSSLVRDVGDATTWAHGWERVVGSEPDEDGRTAARRYGVTWYVAPDQLRDDPDRGATACAVVVPAVTHHLLPGFVCVHGRTDAGPIEGDPTLRIYWHLEASGAAPWIQSLTSALDARGIGFQAKVLAAAEAYTRTDAAVLYLRRDDAPAAWPALTEVRAATQRWLRPATSHLACPIAPGVAVAEDPGTGESFGQHRTRLLAEAAALPAFQSAADEPTRLAVASAHLSAHGYDLHALYREPASRLAFPPLA